MFMFLKTPRGKQLIVFIERYERHVAVAALLFGFIFDTLTLGRPDQLFGNLVLTAYFVISAGAILALALYGRRKTAAPVLLLALLQFSFGNLSGGLLVLYGQSGTFEGSFLFFLVFGAFVIGNEFLRKRYSRLLFHIAAWFFLLLAYVALIVPVLLREIGDLVFLQSVALSVGIISGFLALLYALSPESFEGVKRRVVGVIATIALSFTGLYFLNVIPPVPLSLQQIGIFHAIAREGETYRVDYEKPAWYELFRLTNKTFTITEASGRSFCFSAVFAPGGLITSTVHRFEHYDENEKAWVTVSLVSFPIRGGREGGFRAYSETSQLNEGAWRCSVETDRGALIGRTTFRVVPGKPALSEQVL